MAKKSKAQPDRLGAEDALRLRVALLELEAVRAKASKAVADAAAEAEKIRADVWARYALAPDDAVDLKSYAITRAS